jgi:hypothetical protein
MKWWWKTGILLFSIIILYVSFIRAGFERLKENRNYDILRNVPISFQSKNEFGGFENHCYKLPETNTLPDSPWYFIKSIRDEFWVNLTKNPLEKANILLLIADKKMEEAIKLDKKGRENLANKTVKDAILKLEKSKIIVKSLEQKDVEVIKMTNTINEAENAYKYLIEFLQLDNDIQNLFINKVEKCL